jgi:predicted sugar kinase
LIFVSPSLNIRKSTESKSASRQLATLVAKSTDEGPAITEISLPKPYSSYLAFIKMLIIEIQIAIPEIQLYGGKYNTEGKLNICHIPASRAGPLNHWVLLRLAPSILQVNPWIYY